MAQGKKGGCGSCDKTCATPEQLKKFKADTIDLRQEMMNKRFDLQRENLKETPDSAKVAAIKADIEAVKAKIVAAKTAAKLPDCACSCLEDCPLMDGNCDQCRAGKKADCSCDCCKKAGSCAKCDKCKDCGCKNGKACASCKDCRKSGSKKKSAAGTARKCNNCDKQGK
jgi:hypothetical protein